MNARTGSNKSAIVTTQKSFAHGKLHSATVCNKTGVDVYVIAVEGAVTIVQGENLDLRNFFAWARIPTSESGGLDYGDSGRDCRRCGGFTIVLSLGIPTANLADLTGYDMSTCDVTFS